MSGTLETKEVKGLNFKIIVTGFITTITITASVMATYNGIVNKIDMNSTEEKHQRDIIQLQIREINLRLDYLEEQRRLDEKRDRQSEQLTETK